jgi:hypothetical protein
MYCLWWYKHTWQANFEKQSPILISTNDNVKNLKQSSHFLLFNRRINNHWVVLQPFTVLKIFNYWSSIKIRQIRFHEY